jgi:2-keto-4-pentenoate hydratase
VPRLDANRAAGLLWQHWQTGSALDALPDGLRPTTRAEGHAIQAALPIVAGRSVVGWKIAATSSAGQAHIGVSGPLAGRMLSGEVDAAGATVSLHGNRMRVVEPEFAFRFGSDLPPRDVPYAVDEVLDAVATLQPVFEVPNSRFADFAHAGEAQLQADDACCGRFVVGVAPALDWRALDLPRFEVRARVLDAAGALRLECSGSGSAVLGDPRIALTWLVNELRGLGVGLHAGELVSTGTCMVPLEVQPGDSVQADFGVLGRIALKLSA